MLTQRNFLLAAFSLLSSSLFAQKFNQSIGVSGSTAAVSGYSQQQKASSFVSSRFELTLQQLGITYFPRVDAIKGKNLSLSIGLPFTAGISSTSRYYSTDQVSGSGAPGVEVYRNISGTHFAYDIPVVADLNFGHGSGTTSQKKIGWYIGAGYGYRYTKINTSTGTLTFDGYDELFRIGTRFILSGKQSYTIGASLRLGMNTGTPDIYGLQILKNL